MAINALVTSFLVGAGAGALIVWGKKPSPYEKKQQQQQPQKSYSTNNGFKTIPTSRIERRDSGIEQEPKASAPMKNYWNRKRHDQGYGKEEYTSMTDLEARMGWS